MTSQHDYVFFFTKITSYEAALHIHPLNVFIRACPARCGHAARRLIKGGRCGEESVDIAVSTLFKEATW